MMQMGLNAVTVASHLILILILILCGFRMMHALPGGVADRALRDHALLTGIAVLASVLVIERTYYVLARFLKPSGLDLWSVHPAPELLSLIVSAGAYVAMVPLIIARHENAPHAIRQIAKEWLFFATLFTSIVAVLF